MTRIILASAAAILTTLSFAAVSEAGWRHRNHFGHFNIVIDAGPRYVIDDYGYDERGCHIRKIKKINRYGERVVRKVQVCG